MKNRVRVTVGGGALLGGAAAFMAPHAALAQAMTCTSNGEYLCVNGNTPASSSIGVVVPSGQFASVNNNAPISYTPPSSSNAALGVSTYSGSPQGFSVYNQGNIGLAGGPSTLNDYVFGIWALQQGAPASAGTNTAGIVSVTNSASITLNSPAVQAIGGAAIWAADQGGVGQVQGTYGTQGGASAGVSVVNNGGVNATLSGTTGFAGIQAMSVGGASASGPNLIFNAAAGGAGGPASVTSGASVGVNWTWQNAGSGNTGVYGIQAYSQGGAGGNTDAGTDGGSYGGSGGAAGAATVTLSKFGDVALTVQGTPPSGFPAAPSAVVGAYSIGGAGGYAAQGNTNSGASGGAAGAAQIALTDAFITGSGSDLPGLLAYSAGGAGGYGGTPASGDGTLNPYQNGAAGGSTAGASISVLAQTRSNTIMTTAGGIGQSPAIVAAQLGGAGGYGGNSQDGGFSHSQGGNGGNGGNAGPINIQVQGSSPNVVTLSTNGATSPGIYAYSLGGTAGYGGRSQTNLAGSAQGGTGGNGGAGGDISVTVGSTLIQTQQATSPGIVARTEGGIGGDGGFASASSATGGNGGNGGASGNIFIQTDGGSAITTAGNDSMGILAQTLSAAGGDANGKNTVFSASGGTPGTGGQAGTVTVTNAAAITTAGLTSRGILVQSMAGSGGNGGSSWSLFHTGGITGGAGGAAGAVAVTNSGAISTAGDNSEGILLQSIGGGGGAGGQGSGVFNSPGGSGGNGSNGGGVTLVNSGAISTSGEGSIGVLTQSIGGSGGDGGGSYSVSVAVGGTGGNAAAGGDINATLNSGSNISTTGAGAHGLIFQSIGGGGGNGGSATSTGVAVTVSVGGQGGDGGAGGNVLVSGNGANVSASGSKSAGLIAQSIGGGGGTGGSAMGTSASAVFDASVSVGGRGGNAPSDAGQVSVSLAGGSIATGQDPHLIIGSTAPGSCLGSGGQAGGACNVLPVDSHGVVVQSVGGGGGSGGQATAQAIAIAAPVTPGGSQAAIAAAVAVGGNGGAGGNGGIAQFSLSSGGTITTAGNGGVGALVQSVGGGGGDGGDSSAMAATIGYGSGSVPDGGKAPAAQVTSTVAGTGGKAGNGSTVQVAIGGSVAVDGSSFTCDCNGTNTSIQTFGDFAPGVIAQSIGGGGGNAGVGGGNTQDFGTGASTSVSFNVGRAGSPGGDGGNVTVNLYPGSGIQTWGSGAVGIIAQSIGGGGGTSEGGSFSLGQSLSPPEGATQKQGENVNLGNQQSENGGTGLAVTVSVAAPIVTHGNDATGVLAQSIGGGGGLGGSSGSDASGDNPVLLSLEGREFVSNVVSAIDSGKWTPQQNTTMNHSIGGTGGDGGSGGPVSVTLASAIATLGNPVVAGGNQQASSGDWAHGIVAQSIGGGGGKGGTAIASGTGADPAEHNVFLNTAVGGTGGSGGSGGAVNVNFSSGASIQTVGYAATGVVAQSIGGGGGMAADGSDASGGNLSVGASQTGSGGSGGNAGNVDFENSASNGSTITTAGDFADGLNLQAIGGGGGIAGAGSSAWKAMGQPHVANAMSFTAGGGGASSGAGGNVTVNSNYVNNAGMTINVSGYGAYGILAQSIGGGGGSIIATQAGTGAPTFKLGGQSDNPNATGGTVLVQLTTPTTISANGTAGVGVLAQSIGNGGGIIRVDDGTNSTPSMTTGYNPAFSDQRVPGNANGGAVLINSYANINANGPGGIGILAQSVGGGGGIVLNGTTLYAGAPLQQTSNVCTSSSCSGSPANGYQNFSVNILGGTVSATGTNGIGIFAQAAGYGSPQGGTPDVQVGGATVIGGTDPNHSGTQGGQGGAQEAQSSSAAGIWIDRPGGPGAGTGSVVYDSWVTINAGGVVTNSDGSNGTAIKVTGGGTIALANYGAITGNLDLNAVENANNWVPGPWTPGPLTLRGALLQPRGSLNNYGTWVPGTQALADIQNQGLIAFDNPQMKTRVFGHFNQTGSGRLSPMIDSLNDNVSLLKVDGTATVDGTIVPNAITLLPGTVPVLVAGDLRTTAQAQDSLIFDWDARRSDNTITLTPANANFKPEGVGLSDSQSSLAQYYARAWANSDRTIAGVFGGMSHIDDGGTYKDTLDRFSSKATQVQSIALANSAGTILGSSMSCPVFEKQGTMLSEDNCVWGQVNGRWADQSTTGDTQGYHVSGTTYRVGGQHRIAPGWYLGASAAAGQTWARGKDGSNGDGDTYDGSITLKRVAGPWYFAGSLAAASGSFDSNRHIDVFGQTQTTTSKPSIFLAGSRLRVGYEFAQDTWYVKPYGDLDFIYTHMPGFKEKGAPGYALNVRTNDDFNVALSPMVEVGQRYEVDAKTTLRAYAALGFVWRPDSSYTVTSSFVGADAGNGTFTDYVKTPEVLAKVDLGLQFLRVGGFEVKAGYTADFSHSYISQTASARFAYHF
ncbi:hypothetical protein CAL12_10750 [Bordetella genomosp. 8]|uniref:Autotransporter domain-containing protein n=1 Tax=Bordetella genomosp. 8 TaxID=1416806 RepID=A0A1W6YL53_9BORD|nr:autotransporter outer membrane beta-barrel domain-containing protein [Bordetella genomosp. 8]ARP81273.1 hypothetical protein CAL12_10750 [Bordetella genomosp. 8]